MIDAANVIKVDELPRLIMLLTLINDFESVVGDAPSINRAKYGRTLIDQTNKDDHPLLFLPPNA